MSAPFVVASLVLSHVDVWLIVIVHGHFGHSTAYNGHGVGKDWRYSFIFVDARNGLSEEIQAYTVLVVMVAEKIGH